MAARFPVHEAPDPSKEKVIENALLAMYSGPAPFEWKDKDGELLGPYGPLMYAPDMVGHFFTMGRLVYHPDVIKPHNRELAIMGLLSVHDVPYVRYCHRLGAVRVGLTAEQFEAGCGGQVPAGLNEQEVMAYELGRHLAAVKGPLDDKMYDEALAHFGKSEIVAIANVVGGYLWVSTLVSLNGKQSWS